MAHKTRKARKRPPLTPQQLADRKLWLTGAGDAVPGHTPDFERADQLLQQMVTTYGGPVASFEHAAGVRARSYALTGDWFRFEDHIPERWRGEPDEPAFSQKVQTAKRAVKRIDAAIMDGPTGTAGIATLVFGGAWLVDLWARFVVVMLLIGCFYLFT